jgi:gluconokinase
MAVAKLFAQTNRAVALRRTKCRAGLFGVKRAYRYRLRVSDEVKFVFLRGAYALVERQLRSRHGHFMNTALLQSQFNDLEQPQPDENVLTIELGRTPEEIVERIEAKLNLAGSG